MATYMEIAESKLLYGLVIAGILAIMAFACIFMKRSWTRAKELGFTKKQLMSVVKSSVSFSIVPSIAIVAGLIALVLVVGKPWAQWRLSVIGAVTYELMAAEMATGAAGVSLDSIAQASGVDFTLVLYVMSVGILGGITSSLFIAQRIQNGSLERNQKDPKWGALGNSTFMLTLIVVFLVPMLFEGVVTLLVMLTSMVMAVVLTLIEKKLKQAWLGQFHFGYLFDYGDDVFAALDEFIWIGGEA